MRPPVPKGEVFAASELSSDGHRVNIQLYIAVEDAPAGAGILTVRKLHRRTACSTDDATQRVGDLVYSTESEEPATKILGCTATAFFGARECDDTIVIQTPELDAARHLAQTGHSTPLPGMRQIPLGAAVQNYLQKENDKKRALESPTDSSASATTNAVTLTSPTGINNKAVAQKSLRLQNQTAIQIRALVKKDIAVTRSTKCSTVCEILMPVVMVVVAGLQLLMLTANLHTEKIRPESIGWPSKINNFSQMNSRLPCIFNNSYYHDYTCYNDGSLAATALDNCVACHNATALGLSVPAAIAKGMNESRSHRGWSGYGLGFEYVGGNRFTFYSSNIWYRDIFKWAMMFGAGQESFGGEIDAGFFYEVGPNGRSLVAGLSALFILFSFMVVILRTTSRLVSEKKEGFREHLRVMGTSDGAYIASVFASSMVTMVPICIVIALMTRIVWWRGVDVLMIWFTSQLYALSMVSVAFLMPSVFESTTWASVMSLVLFGGGTCVSPLLTTMPTALQTMMCLFFPFINAWYGLTHALSRTTIQFAVPYETTIGFFFVQIVLYTALGHYLYRLFPGKYGTPAHPLWFLHCSTSNNARADAVSADEVEQIVMRNLRKYFGEQRETAAVDLSLSINRGEILALLGHNGAGKTTTIGMLTGLVEPTQYDAATFEGLDLRSHMNIIRLNIGVCPQHDVLFPSLSARQHFELFANLRGVNITRNRLDELLMFLELPLDNKPVSKYSGGMKRRVSVASALVGEPAVVFLDEPTTGVDEVSRQKLWELLKIERSKGTTMILTTHMMEEAEVLGNRIAIMSAGKLHSLGSAIELKEKYGSGYYLEVAKKLDYDDAAALGLVQKYVPRATVQMNSAVEVTYFLPSECHGEYAALLEMFEHEMSRLGATSYGLNMSTLEDVFVSIAEGSDGAADGDDDKLDGLAEDQVIHQVKNIHELDCTHIFEQNRGPHAVKVVYDIKNIFIKRVTSLHVMYFELMLQIVIPLALVIAGFYAVFEPDTCNSHLMDDSALPDLSVVTAPLFANNLTAADLAMAAAFAANFKELFGKRFPASDFSLPVVTSPGEWNANTWTVDRSFSYTSGGEATKTFLKFMMERNSKLTVAVRASRRASTRFVAFCSQ
eukprot:PhM_4_TR11637/c0_g1_i3/m.40332/K05643/ABCA3; ATP-binding cassette, subfamily A (ABC1), member 3